MHPLGWMLTETVDGVCLLGMMGADLAITNIRGCVAISPRAVLVDAMNYGRSTRPPTLPAASRATCIAASRAGRG